MPVILTIVGLVTSASGFQWCGLEAKSKPGETSVYYENERHIQACCSGGTLDIPESVASNDYRFFGPAHDYLGGYVYWMAVGSSSTPFQLKRLNYVDNRVETVASIDYDTFPMRQEQNKKAFTFDPVYKTVYWISHKRGRGSSTDECHKKRDYSPMPDVCPGNGLYKLEVGDWTYGSQPLNGSTIVRIRSEYWEYTGTVFDPLMEGNSQFTELQTDCEGNLYVADKGTKFAGVYRLPRGANWTTVAEWVFFPTTDGSNTTWFQPAGWYRPKSMVFDGRIPGSLYFISKVANLNEPESIYKMDLTANLGSYTQNTHSGDTSVRVCSLQSAECTIPGFNSDIQCCTLTANTITSWEDSRISRIYRAVYYEILPIVGTGAYMYLFSLGLDPTTETLFFLASKQNYGARALLSAPAGGLSQQSLNFMGHSAIVQWSPGRIILGNCDAYAWSYFLNTQLSPTTEQFKATRAMKYTCPNDPGNGVYHYGSATSTGQSGMVIVPGATAMSQLRPCSNSSFLGMSKAQASAQLKPSGKQTQRCRQAKSGQGDANIPILLYATDSPKYSIRARKLGSPNSFVTIWEQDTKVAFYGPAVDHVNRRLFWIKCEGGTLLELHCFKWDLMEYDFKTGKTTAVWKEADYMALPGQHSKNFVQSSGINQLEFDSATQTLLFQVGVKNSASGKHIIVAYDFSDGNYPAGPCDTRTLTDETARGPGLYSMRAACDGTFYMSSPLGLEQWSFSGLAEQRCVEDTDINPCPYEPTKIQSAAESPIDVVEPGAASMQSGGIFFASDGVVSQAKLSGASARQAIEASGAVVKALTYAAAENMLIAEVDVSGSRQIWSFANLGSSHTVLLPGEGDDLRMNAVWRRGIMPLHVLYLKRAEADAIVVGSEGQGDLSGGGLASKAKFRSTYISALFILLLSCAHVTTWL